MAKKLDKRYSHTVPYDVACDALATLIRWCRDPMIAEPMDGNEGFADAVRIAEIALESVEKKTGWKRPEFGP